MTQTVTVPQSMEELQSAKHKDLQALIKVIKAEDTDALPEINGKSKREVMVPALAEYMGFTESVEEEITEAVNEEIVETVQAEMQDVMDFGDDVPTLESNIEIIMVGDAPKAETGNEEVDSVLAELGLDGLDAQQWLESPEAAEEAEAENNHMAQVIEEQEKPKKARKATIPMDAPIPVRQYKNLLLGIYGNILEEREEAFPAEHKYAGMVHEEVKLERFNAKAHEVFRNTKGHMHLVYTNVGATYLIVMKKPDGTLEPVLEVANKGRGHLRCKQIANHLQVAYNEKNDQEVISGELYAKLAGEIELLPINLTPETPEVTTEMESQGA